MSTDWVADAEHAGVELREAIREAHEALRDIRRTLGEWREIAAGIPADIEVTMGAVLRDHLDAKLADLDAETERALKTVEAGVAADLRRLSHRKDHRR